HKDILEHTLGFLETAEHRQSMPSTYLCTMHSGEDMRGVRRHRRLLGRGQLLAIATGTAQRIHERAEDERTAQVGDAWHLTELELEPLDRPSRTAPKGVDA